MAPRPTATAVVNRYADAQQEAYAGVIKSYNGMKGFGFITCPDIDGDTFFMRSDLPEDAREVNGKFLEGRHVSFQAVAQPDGRSKATGLELAPPIGDGELVPGAIKSYSEKNGYGFITSSCFPEGDIRFNRQEFHSPMPIASQLQGMLVQFVPQALADGKVRATKVVFQNAQTQQMMKGAVVSMQMAGSWAAPAWGAGWEAKGGNGWGNGGKGGYMMGASKGMGKGGGMMSGVVKSYSEKNAYGFITVPGYPDVKFGKADLALGTIAPGASVRFQAVMSHDGRMQAQQVKEANAGGMKRPMTVGQDWGAPPSKIMKGAGKGVTAKSTNQWAEGQIKSFNARKGFGFIVSDSMSGDIFFMRSDLPAEVQSSESLAGTAVGFELMNASNGKLRAQSITMA